MDKRHNYDPIRDENKLWTTKEFAEVLKELADDYASDFADSNEFHKQKHTFIEFIRSFGRWVSW